MPMIGNRDAMGVACQIVQHVFRSAEWSLNCASTTELRGIASIPRAEICLLQHYPGSSDHSCLPWRFMRL